MNLYRYSFDADYRFRVNERLGFYRYLSDKSFLEKKFRAKLGYELDLLHPTTFNEKLQWLKLHDRNPLYTELVDKYAVKQWVTTRIGEPYVVPTYGVWDSFDSIDFGQLPDRFVLKCTHDSGGIAVCRNRETFNLNAARARIESSLKRNYYWLNREWPYKDVRPRIIAEQYLASDPMTGQVISYRFDCFNGLARCVFSRSNGAKDELRLDLFDLDWRHIPFVPNCNDTDHIALVQSLPDDIRALLKRLRRDGAIKKVELCTIWGEAHLIDGTLQSNVNLTILREKLRSQTPGPWAELPRGCVLISGNMVLWLHEEDTGTRNVFGEPSDYKLYRFTDGRIVTLICEDRHLGKGMSETYYDEGWNRMDLTEGGHPAKAARSAPPHFEEMKDIARELGEGMPFVRVDFYEGPQRPLFGELTFYTAAGFEQFDPPEWDEQFGKWVDLSGAYGS